ncbi:hypothetical protein [Amphritea sp.]|uniref:hypothetical protein n=1 Tax=Amphritea sp. TaxID=1872502 RepID=UPI0025C59879|nr:hypothetical protein [Amphritea sp.]
MMIHSYGQSFAVSQSQQADAGTSIAVAGGNDLPVKKDNADSVQISEAAKSKMLAELKGGELVDFTGENGMYKLGLMALGSNAVQAWSTKGLEVSDEAVIAAGKAFQEGLKQKIEESGASLAGSGGLALNKYQIVINSQEVPDWFMKEYENVLSSMDNNEMKAAFEKGDVFFTSKPSSSSIDALASYAQWQKHNN